MAVELHLPVAQNEVVSVLQINDPRAQALAAELARRTGESLDDAILKSLEQRLARETARRSDPNLVGDLREISGRAAALPLLDNRSDDEILGNNDHGTFE